jgi:hypothetical protein
MINTTPQEVFEFFKSKALSQHDKRYYHPGSTSDPEIFDEMSRALTDKYLPKLIETCGQKTLLHTNDFWDDSNHNEVRHRGYVTKRSGKYLLDELFKNSDAKFYCTIETENRIELVTKSVLFSGMSHLFSTKRINSKESMMLLDNELPVSSLISVTYYPDTNSICYFESDAIWSTTKKRHIYLKKSPKIKVTVNFDRKWTRIMDHGKIRYLSLKNWEDYIVLFEYDLLLKLMMLDNPNLEYLKDIPVKNISIPNKTLRKSSNLKALVKNHIGSSCTYLLTKFDLTDVVNLCEFVKGDSSSIDSITNRIRVIKDDEFETLNHLKKSHNPGSLNIIIYFMYVHGVEFFKELHSDYLGGNFEERHRVLYREKLNIIRDLIRMWPKKKNNDIIPVKARSYRRLEKLHDETSFYITVNATEEFKVNNKFKSVFTQDSPFIYSHVDNKEKLVREGLEMKHCVASRRDNIQNGNSCVYTILTPSYNSDTKAGRFTAEIGINTIGEFYVKEIRGIRNINPSGDVLEQVEKDFIKKDLMNANEQLAEIGNFVYNHDTLVF